MNLGSRGFYRRVAQELLIFESNCHTPGRREIPSQRKTVEIPAWKNHVITRPSWLLRSGDDAGHCAILAADQTTLADRCHTNDS